MADKTIGSLPAASALDDPSLLVVEQAGVAMKLAGLLLKQYCQNAVAGQVAQAAASATEAGGSAEDAEAWSVGKRNGVDVLNTDPAYHNNAKYYAEQGYTRQEIDALLSEYRKSTAQDTIDSGKEDKTNKVTSISSASTNAQYPSAKAVYDYIQSLDGNGVKY